MTKTNKSVLEKNLILASSAGVKIKSFSQIISEAKAKKEGAVEWPTGEEDKRAISILNKWVYELLNNGGGNAQEEEDQMRRNDEEGYFYFSPVFQDYLKKAMETIKNLGIEDKMPLIVKWVEYNLKYNGTPSIGKNAADAYDEIRLISNWDDLMIRSLDFLDDGE